MHRHAVIYFVFYKVPQKVNARNPKMKLGKQFHLQLHLKTI